MYHPKKYQQSSSKSSSSDDNSREIKRPTLVPHSFVRWSKEYFIEAIRDFEEVGEALKLGKHPDWQHKTFWNHVLDTGQYTKNSLLQAKEDAVQCEELKLRMSDFIKRQTRYKSALKMLYADILQHLSNESMNLLTQDSEEYEKCDRDQDPLQLWEILKKCHSQIGRKVSDEELRQKKLKVESLKQWHPSTLKVRKLEEHNRAWRDSYEEACHLGVQWTEDEIIRVYLRSVDSTLIIADLSQILKEGSTEFPQTLTEASYWVTATVQRYKGIQECQPGKGVREPGNGPKSHSVMAESAGDGGDLDECAFCKKKHYGGAQKCTRLLKLMREKPDVVHEYTQHNKNGNSGSKHYKKVDKNGRKAAGTSRKGKANARRWSQREKDDKPPASHKSVTQDSVDDVTGKQAKQLLKEMLKINSVGELNFHALHVTPLASYSSKITPKLNSYMLDTGSNCVIMGNRDLVTNIKSIPPTIINGMGSKQVTEVGECLFGPCYVANIPLNIVADAAVTKKYTLQYDSTKSVHYIVGGDVLWRRGDHGLLWLDHEDALLLEYKHELRTANVIFDNLESGQSVLPTSALLAYPSNEVEELSPRHYSAVEKQRAREVKRIHDVLGHPSDARLGILFDSGCINGNPYTSRDVRIMRTLHGPCVACIKGKTTAPTQGQVINKWIAAAPGERLCMDIYLVSILSRKGKFLIMPLLLVVDDYTGYLNLVLLPSKTKEAVQAALVNIVDFYNQYEWKVKEIRSDRENVFLSLRSDLRKIGIELDAIGTDQHEKKAERAARTLREGLITVKQSLWYRAPQFLLPYFCQDIASIKNCLPNRNTLSRSPREIVEGTKISFDQHLKVPLGLVGEFRVPEGTHTAHGEEEREALKNESRTATGIVVRRNLDSHGTLQVYLIDTGKFVNRAKLLQARRQSADLRKQLETLSPKQDIDINDSIKVCPKLTSSYKRRQGEVDLQPETDRGDSISDNSPVSDREERGTLDGPNDMENTTSEAVTDDNEEEMDVQEPDEGDPGSDSESEKADEDKSSSYSADSSDEDDADSATLGNDMPDELPKRPKRAAKLVRKVRGNNKPNRINNKKRRKPDMSVPAAERKSARTKSMPSRFANAANDNMNIYTAKEKYPNEYKESMEKELRQFHDKSVAEVIDVPVQGLKHSKIIGVKGFFKASSDLETGKFKKLKFRLVPQGHLIDRSLYGMEETTSPTVALETVMAAINVAAYERRIGFTMDVPGAYLNAELKEPHMVKFPPDLAREYVRLFPQYKSRLQKDGSLLMLVRRAFYGLPESSALWYKEFSQFLLEQGFKQHPADKGLFIKSSSKGSLIALLWVDDILGWSTNDLLIKELEEVVNAKYGDSRLNTGKVLHYIGMTITQPDRNGAISIGQQEYLRKIIRTVGVTTKATNPNHPNLFKPKQKDQNKVSKTLFASYLMMAMFAGKRSRGDVLTPCSILATRAQDPDEADFLALTRIYEYLNETIDLLLTFSPSSMELHYWIDAAYALHPKDMRGHTGILVTLGYNNGPIFLKSSKQKLHARSSSEAELLALDDGFMHLLWLRQVMDFLGYPQSPAIVYQDNKSTICVCETGHSKNGKLKHMAVRYYFIHGQITANIVKLKYCKTSQMVADILTKPLTGLLFNVFRKRLLNLQIINHNRQQQEN